MTEAYLLQDLAIVVVIAGLMTLLCHALRQPVVLGYIVAGLIIGPFTPPFSLVRDFHSIHTMAELGLVFLMFTLGLEFNLPKLRKVGFSAALATALEVLGMLWIGYGMGRFFGWSTTDSIFLGAILSISSTTIIVKVFTDLKMMDEDFTQVVLGILILEDIVAVLILSILSGLASTRDAGAAMAVTALLKISFFVIIFLVAGLSLIPRFLHWIARFQSKEMTGIVALGCCLSGAMLAHQFGFSIALGAFLMGAVVAASREAAQIGEWMHPVRDMFSAIFFVAVGMMIEPRMLWTYKWPILVITTVTLTGKVLSVALGSFLAGYGVKTSFKIGISLAQIGEFSFVIASLGAASKVTGDFLYPIAVAVSAITAFSKPYLIRRIEGLSGGLAGIIPQPVQSMLENYERWAQRLGERKAGSATANIFSKYFVRLLIYCAVWACVLLITRIASRVLSSGSSGHLTEMLFVLWTFSGIASLPLFMAISKYINHIALILITRATQSSKILQHVNIRLLYNALQFLVLSSLVFFYLVFAAPYFSGMLLLSGIAAAIALAGFVLRPLEVTAKEKLEKILDEVLGLATSEPTHQGALISGRHNALINDLGEQLVLTDASPAVDKTIRALGVREQTGATVVAIYRAGSLISNPSPDTQLLANDILVVWGDKAQRVGARALLAGRG